MLACFHSDGILPQLSDFLKMIRRIGEITSLHSFSILLGILSGPAALCGFRLFSNFFMPVSVMLMFCISRCGLCQDETRCVVVSKNYRQIIICQCPWAVQ